MLLEGGPPTFVVNDAYAAQEDSTGSLLYYTKYGVPGLWRRAIDGGPETLIVETLDPVDAESWAVTGDGIYYVDRTAGTDQIRFYDPRNGASNSVVRAANPIPAGKASLSVLPHGSFLLYGQIDERESDVMLVEGL